MQILVTIAADTPALDSAAEVVRGPMGGAPTAVGALVGPTEPFGEAELAMMPRLRVLAVAGAGTDAVDLETLERRGVRIVSAPNSTADPTAELTMCLVLMVSRGVRGASEELASGEWTGWSFDHIVGRGVAGLTLGLVGYGRIGRRVAARATAFGMDVLHHARHDTHVPGFIPDLRELLSRSDIVSLHLPLTHESKGLLGHEALGAMKPGSALINTSRGGLVDEAALVEALTEGRLSGAGIDVFASEPGTPWNLLDVPNLVVTPHIGTATADARSSMVTEASGALLDALHETARGSSDAGAAAKGT